MADHHTLNKENIIYMEFLEMYINNFLKFKKKKVQVIEWALFNEKIVLIFR